MGQSSNPEALAYRFEGWRVQAERGHRILRGLVDGAQEFDPPGDGTITVRVGYAEWRSARDEALRPGPEPITPPSSTE